MKYFKFALHKRYFDTGFGVLNYVKYLVGFFALASLNWKATLIVGFAYGVACYLVGWYWINKGIWEAENEVSNQFNPFQREVRKLIKKNRKLK